MGQSRVVDAKVTAGGARGVLLLCTSQDTVNALASILYNAGETVVSYQSLNDAWHCVKMGEVGCVVLDVSVPGADALAFFRLVRSTRQTDQLPFLFLIGDDFVVPQLNGATPEIAQDEWLVLPCPAGQFLGKVRALLHNVALQAQPKKKAGDAAEPGSADFAISPDELLAVPGSVFAGRLGVLDVTKIVSMVEPLRLTGVLKVSDGKRFGQVHFVAGAVRHAELHDISGPDALFLLFHLKTGAFRFDLEEPTGAHTIEGNTMALLLEGLRQMDEAKALIKAFKETRPASARMPAQQPLSS